MILLMIMKEICLIIMENWENLLFLQLKITVLCQKKDKKRLMNI